MLSLIKMALRITTNAYDDELSVLIYSCMKDLEIAGVNPDKLSAQTDDQNIIRAVVTFCKMSFGNPDRYEELKRSYDEQKAQMSTSLEYGVFDNVE